jgi:hypothetical protein
MALTGVALGLAYLARAAYFPLAVLCVGGMAALFRDRRVALAGAAFALVAGPFVIAISMAKGHFTYGEAGKLNYAWQVNGAARSYHWQGEGRDVGTPLHPTRKVMDSPEVFEFATPVAGTYPPWYDPSYWYAGVHPRFSFSRQWPVFCRYARYWLALLLVTPGLIVTLPSILRSRDAAVAAFRKIGWLVALPLVACGMYCLLVVDARHVAVFLAVIGMAVLGVAHRQLRLRRWMLTCAYMSTVGFIAFPTAIGLYAVLADATHGAERFGNPAWAISQGMAAAGLRPGDRIGYIGCGINAYRARLSRVKIVADVNYVYDVNDDLPVTLRENTREIEKFWVADSHTQRAVLDAFAKAGARYAVADHIPARANLDGWVRVDQQTYLRRLAPSGDATGDSRGSQQKRTLAASKRSSSVRATADTASVARTR